MERILFSGCAAEIYRLAAGVAKPQPMPAAEQAECRLLLAQRP
jgi:hypothetical protein